MCVWTLKRHRLVLNGQGWRHHRSTAVSTDIMTLARPGKKRGRDISPEEKLRHQVGKTKSCSVTRSVQDRGMTTVLP